MPIFSATSERFITANNELDRAGPQIKPIDVNFQSQKTLEIFDKNSADKILSKKDKGVESALANVN